MEKRIDALLNDYPLNRFEIWLKIFMKNEAQRENLRLYLKFLCKNKPIYMWWTKQP